MVTDLVVHYQSLKNISNDLKKRRRLRKWPWQLSGAWYLVPQLGVPRDIRFMLRVVSSQLNFRQSIKFLAY